MIIILAVTINIYGWWTLWLTEQAGENWLMFIPGFTGNREFSRGGLDIWMLGSSWMGVRDLKGASGMAAMWGGFEDQRLNRQCSALLLGTQTGTAVLWCVWGIGLACTWLLEKHFFLKWSSGGLAGQVGQLLISLPCQWGNRFPEVAQCPQNPFSQRCLSLLRICWHLRPWNSLQSPLTNHVIKINFFFFFALVQSNFDPQILYSRLIFFFLNKALGFLDFSHISYHATMKEIQNDVLISIELNWDNWLCGGGGESGERSFTQISPGLM